MAPSADQAGDSPGLYWLEADVAPAVAPILPFGTVVGSGLIINSNAITDSAADDAAVTITAGGTFYNTTTGTVSETGAYGTGVYLDGGSLINEGLITASATGSHGVRMAAGEAFTNDGMIAASYAITGSVDEAITNAASGLIQGYDYGIAIDSGVITNSGTIIAKATGSGGAIYDIDGGGVTNLGTGFIVGADGIKFASGAGQVENYGTIEGTSDVGGGIGIELKAGGNITNVAGGTIEASRAIVSYRNYGVTIDNAGTIDGTTAIGIYAKYSTGFDLTNQSGGEILGHGRGIEFGSGTLLNEGVIHASLIIGNVSAGLAIYAVDGGYVSNASTGSISSRDGIEFGAGGAGTLENAGRVVGDIGVATAFGVSLAGYGTIINEAGGYITGYDGILDTSADGVTVVNAGTIYGAAAGYAIKLGSGNDRVELAAGSKFTGSVSGGSGTNVLELLAGGGQGTLTGLGTDYRDFQQVTIDTAASWEFAGANGMLLRSTLSVLGTLTNTGSLEDQGSITVYGSLENTGTIAGPVRLSTPISVTGTGDLDNAAGATIAFPEGSITAVDMTGGTFTNEGLLYLSSSDDVGVYMTAGTLVNSGSIYLSGAGGTGIHLAGGSLSNTGKILGGSSGIGVLMADSQSFYNAGYVFGQSEGVKGYLDESVTNAAGGSISASDYGIEVQSGSVLNEGNARNDDLTGGAAIDLGTGTLTNAASGYIESSNDAILFGSGVGTVFNSGTVLGTSTVGGAAIGIKLQYGGYIFNGTDAVVEGTTAIRGYNSGATSIVNAGTLDGTYDFGIYLGANNPLYLDNQAGGTIYGRALGVVFGHGGTIVNAGTIESPGGTFAIRGMYGGTVINQVGGLISGYSPISLGGTVAATVENMGTIDSTGIYAIQFDRGNARLELGEGGTITGKVVGGSGDNVLELVAGPTEGTLNKFGVQYLAFETITVDAGADWAFATADTLAPRYTLSILGTLNNTGALLDNGTIVDSGTLENTGSISDHTSFGIAVTVTSTGSLDNAAGAEIYDNGNNGEAIYLEGGTVSNEGTLDSAGNDGIGIIIAGGTLGNTGLIEGPPANGIGVEFTHGGTFTDTAGTIGGHVAVQSQGNYAFTLTNAALIGSTNAYIGVNAAAALGVSILNDGAGLIEAGHGAAIIIGSGQITNAGSIETGTGYTALQTADGLTLFNDATGLITGGGGVLIGGTGTVINYGSIKATSVAAGETDFGVYLHGGGTLVNEAGGTIVGYLGGVVFGNQPDETLVNKGSILAASGEDAVKFYGGLDHLTIYAGAYFGGDVVGYRASSNTIALAGGTAPLPGTFSGFGTEFQSFQSVDVETGANWQFNGANTFASGYVLNVYGALTNVGTLASYASIDVTGTLVNAAGALLESLTLTSTAVSITGAGTLDNLGIIATPTTTGTAVYFDSTGGFENSGTIEGLVVFGPASAVGPIVNAGTIKETGLNVRAVEFGGGVPVFQNDGYIHASGASGDAVDLAATGGGTIVNETGATISIYTGGYNAAIATNYTSSVTNAAGGLIAATGPDAGEKGIQGGARSHLYVLNQGTLTGVNAGLYQAYGGTVSLVNQALIEATGASGAGVDLVGSGAISNTGTIDGTSGSGIGVEVSFSTASITNAAGGLIEGGRAGVYIDENAHVTLVDAGTIYGGTYAVLFASTGNVLEVEAGAEFHGEVQGDQGTLELAAGSRTGTLSGLGISYTGFSLVTIGAGIDWVFYGSNTVAAGEDLAVGGTVAVNGILADAGTISVASGGALDFGSGNDVLKLIGNAVLSAQGAVDGGGGTNTLALYGSGGTLSGFGTNFTNFQELAVIFNADWTLAGTNTIAAGETLEDAGTLGVSGTFTDDGTISGAGTVALSSATDVLALASDATLFAYVTGAGGTLDLGSGSSTGILDGVSRLSGFGELAVASGATWATYGTIGTGTLLANQGVLLTTGVLTLKDTVSNARGTLFADGGTIDLYNATITGGALTDSAGGSFVGSGNASLGTVAIDANISVAAGAGLTLAGSDTNAGTLTIIGNLYIDGQFTNTGTIINNAAGGSPAIAAGGSVTNASGGLIVATYAVGDSGLSMGASVYLQNAGTIDASSFGVEELGTADYVVNRGLIEATKIGLEDDNGGSLSNSGTIDAVAGGGVGLRIDTVGATVTNLAGGVIEGSAYGIFIYQHAGTHTTLVNAGTIEGLVGPALAISGTGVTVEFDAGGVFIGKVDGGGSSTLALVQGVNAGTLAALGTNYVGFSAIDVAAGAEWVFTGSNSVTAGDTLGIAGTLTVSGTLADAGAISVASGGALLFGSGNDVLDLTGNAVLDAQGAVDGGGGTNTLELSGTGGTLSGFASNFKHFQVLSVDAGASWTLGGTNTIIAGETLVDDGTLGVSGTFTDDGAITIGAGGTLQLSAATDVFDLAAGATLTGSVAGAGGTLDLDTGSGTGVIASLTTLTGFGELAVSAGATWAVDGAIGAGTLLANQGVLLTTGLLGLYGTVANTGGTLEAAGGTINLYGATITGGTLTDSAGGSFVVSPVGGATTLGTVDIAADLSVAGSATLTLAGIDMNTGTMNVIGYLNVAGTLVNEAGGFIVGDGVNRSLLSIGSGASLANAGTIAALFENSTVVEVSGAGLFTNTGTIGAEGSVSTSVEFVGPAAFANAGVIFASGSSDIGVDIAPDTTGASGIFTNDGTVEADGTSGIAVELAHYGTLVNAAGATIFATTPAGNGFAVDLLDGGSVTNVAGGLISATSTLDSGIYSNSNAPIYVLNDGTIYGEGRGINVDGTGTIINHGVIDADAANGFGVVMLGGTLENSGTIVSNQGSGVDVSNEKLVINAAGGLIKGGQYGLVMSSTGQSGTLVNAGTIFGHNGIAVVMGGPHDVLQVEAGAVFMGRVNGGYGTLELSAGTGIGTLNALGADYFNFDTVEVDAGTDWVFTGSNTVGITTTLIDSGTITVNGTLTDSDAITVAAGGVLAFGSGNDVFDLTGGAVLDATGSVDGGGGTNTLELSGTNGTLSGFASNFTNFQVLSVDAGAYWTLGGTNTVSEGETLVDDGVLIVSGTFTDDGTITIGAAGELKLSAGTNVFDLAAGATLTGNVAGAGGTLDLEAGSGAVANLDSFTGFSELAVTDGGTWTVAGTIGAGTLIANQGVLLTAGALTLDGTISNTGGTLDAAGGTIDLNGVDLTGGTLDSSGGGSFVVGGGLSSTLTSIALAGDLSVAAGATLTLAGTDSNTGTLTGTGALDITGAFTNSGVIDGAAALTGTLTNDGVIQTLTGTGTLVNAGTVTGPAAATLVVFDAGATFDGVVSSSTLELAAGTGTGTLSGIGTNFTAHLVQVDTATEWVFDGYNGFGPSVAWNLDDLGTLTLDGTLVNHDGVTVAAGAEFINRGTLSLPGGTLDIAGTVENTGGTITSTGQDYIDLSAGAELIGGTISDSDGNNATNAGTLAITGSATLDGVTLIGSQVTIAAGATLTEIGSVAFDQLNLTNLGVVAGNVTLSAGTNFYDLTGSTVRGTVFSDGIVTAEGTIGVGGVALVLGSATAELALASGAVFDGTVEGGGGTLALDAGIGTGTLNGLGTNFTNFSQIDVNAPWVFEGANTIGVGDTLDVAGPLTVDGTLTDAGAITIAATDVLTFGAGNDVFDLTGNAVLDASGAVDGGGGTNTLELSGTGGTLSGFGTNFTNFQVVSVDAAAAWSLAGTNTLTAAESLSDQGALTLNGTLAVDGAATVASGGTLTVNGTLTDSGTITVASGGALDFGAGNDVFDLTAGSVLNATGAVDGGGGTNTLELSGTGGTLSGFGTNFTDFQVLSVAAGAAWSLAGNNTLSASEQLIAAGGLTINGALVDDGGITLASGGTLTVNGTLTDSGTISIASGGALDFGAGNDVFDLTGGAVLLANGAVDGGGGTNTLELSGTGGTLSGFGTNFTHFQVLSVDAGASWTLGGTNTVTQAETLVDGGTLGVSGTFTDDGTIEIGGSGVLKLSAATDVFDLAAGASLTGSVAGSGGTLDLGTGSGTGDITSLGTFTGFGALAVASGATWAVAGTIGAGTLLADQGVLLTTGVLTLEDTITNTGGTLEAAGGVIDLNGVDLTGGTLIGSGGGSFSVGGGVSSTLTGVALDGTLSIAAGSTLVLAGADTNAGTLSGTVDVTGTLTNEAGGVIQSVTGTGTLVNAGTVSGKAQASVVVFDAGAVFGGAVSGTTLDLASGIGTGTLNGLGTNFTAFSRIDVNAAWVFTGANTIGAGDTLEVASTLTVDGTLTDAGAVTVASGDVLAFGAGNDVFDLTGNAVLDASGAVSGGTLDLGTGSGTGDITSLGTFTGFGALAVASGATWAVAGTIGAGTLLADQGVLLTTGVLTLEDTITNTGGTLDAAGGVIDLNGVDLTGGTLIGSGGGSFSVGGGVASTLTGVALDGTLSIAAGSTLVLAGSETNAGTLSGTVDVTGTLTNEAGGEIQSVTGTGTLVNAGTVSGQAQASVVVFDAGAVFGGVVSGTTLDLAAGAGTGTLNALGTSFTGFKDISVAAGTEWVFTGSNSVASGDSLGIAGTLTIDGTIADAGAISVASGGALLFGSGNDVLDLTGNAVLDAEGAVDGGGGTNTLELSGTGGTLSGFASNFKDFQVLSVDAGASWTLGGTNTVISGETLADDGTLSVSGTFTDEGAITIGAAGVLQLSAATDVFDLAAGATLTGSVAGSGGTLDLGTGSGAIPNLNSFTGFGEVALGSGATWTLAGTIGGGTLLANQGALIATGALTLDGAVTNTGGTIDAAGGTIDLGGVDLTGGTLTSSGGGYNYDRSGQVTLTSVAIGGTLELAGLVTLTLAGDASNAGTIDLGTSPTRGGTDTDITGSFTNTGTLTGGSNNDFIIVSGTLENQGVITDNFITIAATGSLVNAAGATIAGGITASGGPGMLVNAGRLTTPYVTGIYFEAGGYIDNQLGGEIGGQLAIDIQGGAGTVVNAGTIGALYLASGTVDNAAGGVLSGYVHIGGGGTLINAGSIAGTVSAGLVRFDAGATFGGVVSGNTLELAAGSGIGTLSGFGTNFTGFTSVLVDAGAAWSLAGNNTLTAAETLLDQGVLTVNGTLSVDGTANVAAGGTLSVNGALTDAGTISIAAGGALDFGAGNDVFDLTGTAVLEAVGAVDGGGGTNTLELSGAGGTLSGFGTNFVDFQLLSVDTGASWSLGGTDTLTASEQLIDDGTLTITGSLANAGTITGTSSLLLAAGVSLTNSGTIQFDAPLGLAIEGTGSSTITNLGLILNTGAGATGTYVQAIRLLAGGSVTNAAGAVISDIAGFGRGIEADSGAVIVNAGTIEGSDSGIFLGVGGSVTNQTTGLVETNATDGFGIVLRAGTLANAGIIIAGGTAGTGVEVSSGSITNQSGGLIEATGNQAAAIDINGTATIANAGTLLNSGLNGSAIIASAAAIITNAAGGVIEESSTGLSGDLEAGVDLTAGGNLTNFGLIEAPGSIVDGVILAGGAGLYNAGTITVGAGSGVLIGAGSSATNAAHGEITATGALGRGVNLDGGTLTNDGGIAGAGVGVFLHDPASVSNEGTISGTGGTGVGIYLYAGGSVSNAGLIEGVAEAAYLRGGSLTNTGTLLATGAGGIGLDLAGDAVATDQGLIEGAIGVEILGASATLEVSGTIIGTGGSAILLGGAGDLLKWDAGAVIDGAIAGGGGTLELAAGSATIGTLAGLGGAITNFSLIQIKQNALWDLDGQDTLSAGETLDAAGALLVSGSLLDEGAVAVGGSLDLTGTIAITDGAMAISGALTGAGLIELSDFGSLDLGAAASGGTIDFTDGTGLLTIANAGGFADQIAGFGHGDTIDLTGVSFSSADTVTYAAGHAIVYDNGSIVADFLLSGLPPGAELSLQSDQHGGTDLIDPTGPACFLAGTSLTTAAGEVAVDDLVPGMLVATIAGKLAPIRWIGRRRYDPAALQIGRDKVLPIIIRAGALGENLPRRDLLVSPEHCLYVGAALVPARLLVNGRSIVQRRSLEPIDYIHVELDEHAILLAEGAAAESYREIGNNRAEFAITAGTASPPSDACAPILTAGPELGAIREALERQVVSVCRADEVAAA